MKTYVHQSLFKMPKQKINGIIEYPSYFKKGSEIAKLLSSRKLLKISINRDNTYITMNSNAAMIDVIMKNFEPCAEEDFNNNYNVALSKLAMSTSV